MAHVCFNALKFIHFLISDPWHHWAISWVGVAHWKPRPTPSLSGCTEADTGRRTDRRRPPTDANQPTTTGIQGALGLSLFGVDSGNQLYRSRSSWLSIGRTAKVNPFYTLIFIKLCILCFMSIQKLDANLFLEFNCLRIYLKSTFVAIN